MNRIILIGNLGKDPEVRQINDTTLATFTLATTEKWKNGERTDWHTVKVWGGLAGVVEKYLRRGNKVMIEGRIQYDEVEKDGQKKWYTSIIASGMEMLGSPTHRETPADAPVTDANTPALGQQVVDGDVIDDDLPF